MNVDSKNVKLTKSISGREST